MRVSLRRKLFVIGVVYVVEGFPMGLFDRVLPTFLRRLEVSQAEIGFVAGLSIAWSLKVFWSPLIERFGERRFWIAGSLVAMAAALVMLSGLDSPRLALWAWAALAALCIGSATQDIAIDAYTIGLLERGEEGPANSMRMTAYRIGMVGLGNALLFLPRWVGWEGALLIGATTCLAMAASVLATPRVEVPVEERRAWWRALRRWLGRGGALPVFAFVLLYRVGDLAMAPMINPFWVDRGFSNEEIGTVSGWLGGIATIAGAWVGGGAVARLGIARSLWLLGALALASNLGYAAAAAWPELGSRGVYAASIVESFCAGMAGVGFMSFLMRISEKEHAAVQYALLTAVYNLAGALLKIPSGVLTEALGYATYFALTAGLALPAFAFLPRATRWLAPVRKG